MREVKVLNRSLTSGSCFLGPNEQKELKLGGMIGSSRVHCVFQFEPFQRLGRSLLANPLRRLFSVLVAISREKW